MLYSDRDIRRALQDGEIAIEGFRVEALQPASVDFHLSDRAFKKWRGSTRDSKFIVPWEDQRDQMDDELPTMIPKGSQPTSGTYGACFVLGPGQFALASTTERVAIGTAVAGRLEGKSSLARLGLIIHTTAGFFDPGFEGYPTLELLNVSPRPMLLRPGMAIAQMSFFQLKTMCENPYEVKGHYQGQGADPEPSHFHENFQDPD